MWDWDVTTGTVDFSESWASLLGYLPGEIEPTYQAWKRLVHPDDLPHVARVISDNLRAAMSFFEVEYRMLSKDGGWIWLLGKGKVVARDAEGKATRMAGVDMDITSRKELEERLHRRQDELYYAQRLTAAGELTAIVAHELNQPLGAISNYVGGALLRYPELLSANPPLAKVLGQTLKLTQRAMSVVQGIRGLVRKQEGKPEWVSLEVVVEEVLIPLRRELSHKQIRLSLDIPPKLPQLRCEKVHLQQLLLNLILNAVQAMETPECSERKLLLRARLTSAQKLEITVSDTGPGIAPEIAKHLFEPFHSTKPEGIGLGLSICRTITEAYGGHISVQSMPRQGTVFSVAWPMEAEEEEHVG